MEDQEERMKNKKYRSLKMFPSDIILKFKNIVKFKIIKVKKVYPLLIGSIPLIKLTSSVVCLHEVYEEPWREHKETLVYSDYVSV